MTGTNTILRHMYLYLYCICICISLAGETNGDERNPAAHRSEAQPVRSNPGGDGEGGHGSGTSYGHEVNINIE